MEMNLPESKTIDEVRRWRKEAYEARRGMTIEQQREHDRKVAEQLGLSHLREIQIVPPWKKQSDLDAA